MKKCIIKTCKNPREEKIGFISFHKICYPCYQKWEKYTRTHTAKISPKEAYCHLWIRHQNLKQKLREIRDELNLAKNIT